MKLLSEAPIYVDTYGYTHMPTYILSVSFQNLLPFFGSHGILSSGSRFSTSQVKKQIQNGFLPIIIVNFAEVEEMRIYNDKKDAFPNTKMVAVGALKGGTGKTAFTFNLAGYLAAEAKVLLIDCDPQGNTTRNLNISSDYRDDRSVKDIYEGLNPDPEDIVLHDLLNIYPSASEMPYNTERIFPAREELNMGNLEAFTQQLSDNLDLIPGNLYLNESDFRLNAIAFEEGIQSSISIIQEYLFEYKDYFSKYDYIIFDTNPSMTLTNQNAFMAADKIILICDPDSNSAAGTDGFIQLYSTALANAELPEDDKIAAIVLNKLKRTILSNDLKSFMLSHPYFGDIVLEHGIRDNEAFRWANARKKPVPYLTVKDYNNAGAIRRANVDLQYVVSELKEKGVL